MWSVFCCIKDLWVPMIIWDKGHEIGLFLHTSSWIVITSLDLLMASFKFCSTELIFIIYCLVIRAAVP